MSPLHPVTASSQTALLDDLSAINLPIADSLRISFVSTVPAIGLSTVAAASMRHLAHAHPGRVLAVDPRPGQAGSLLMAAPEEPPADVLSRLPVSARPWLSYSHGICVSGFDGATAAGWNTTVAPIARYFDIVATDWGTQPLPAMGPVARLSNVFCIAGSYRRGSAESAIAVARAVTAGAPGVRAVVVLIDATRTHSTWPRTIAPTLPFPVVAFPYDSSLAAHQGPRNRTERLGMTLAAHLIGKPEVSHG